MHLRPSHLLSHPYTPPRSYLLTTQAHAADLALTLPTHLQRSTHTWPSELSQPKLRRSATRCSPRPVPACHYSKTAPTPTPAASRRACSPCKSGVEASGMVRRCHSSQRLETPEKRHRSQGDDGSIGPSALSGPAIVTGSISAQQAAASGRSQRARAVPAATERRPRQV